MEGVTEGVHFGALLLQMYPCQLQADILNSKFQDFWRRIDLVPQQDSLQLQPAASSGVVQKHWFGHSCFVVKFQKVKQKMWKFCAAFVSCRSEKSFWNSKGGKKATFIECEQGWDFGGLFIYFLIFLLLMICFMDRFFSKFTIFYCCNCVLSTLVISEFFVLHVYFWFLNSFVCSCVVMLFLFLFPNLFCRPALKISWRIWFCLPVFVCKKKKNSDPVLGTIRFQWNISSITNQRMHWLQSGQTFGGFCFVLFFSICLLLSVLLWGVKMNTRRWQLRVSKQLVPM